MTTGRNFPPGKLWEVSTPSHLSEQDYLRAVRENQASALYGSSARIVLSECSNQLA